MRQFHFLRKNPPFFIAGAVHLHPSSFVLLPLINKIKQTWLQYFSRSITVPNPLSKASNILASKLQLPCRSSHCASSCCSPPSSTDSKRSTLKTQPHSYKILILNYGRPLLQTLKDQTNGCYHGCYMMI